MYVRALLTLINSMVCTQSTDLTKILQTCSPDTSFGLFKEQQWPAAWAGASEGTHIPRLTATVLRIRSLDGKDVNHIPA
jgi:hypothetical protein